MYVGEILIYFGYALLAQHWLPWVVNSIFWFGIFRTNMMKKDKSISRHKGFAEYAEKSGMLFPTFSLSDIPALFVSQKSASKKD
jgi:protein-S-isoprenylcysteine O-methyltransferase Ste14